MIQTRRAACYSTNSPSSTRFNACVLDNAPGLSSDELKRAEREELKRAKREELKRAEREAICLYDFSGDEYA